MSLRVCSTFRAAPAKRRPGTRIRQETNARPADGIRSHNPARVCLAALGAVCVAVLAARPALAAPPSGAAQPQSPNIVWIWADNLGYGDLGCYGHPSIQSPVIDRIAQDGVRLTQYYVAHVVCSPSRAALLTGRQPFRVGIVDVLRPDGPSGLPHDEVTLAEALREQGYATQAVGKWHLGDRREYLPTRHGFDGYLGIPYSMDMKPTVLIRDEEIVEYLPGDKVADITERFTAEAVRFIQNHHDRPFFLYLSHTIPHPPLRLPAGVGDPDRPLYEQAIEHLDRQTGVVLDALERLGISGRTLVVVTSDNGPMHQAGDAGGLRGRIRDSYEGGIRVPFVARWPERIPGGRVIDTPVIAYDLFPTLLSLAGGNLPPDRTYDGQDIWPLLAGSGDVDRRQPFYWVYDDNLTALRDGRWKLHVGHRDRQLPSPELYDLQADPHESNDLADKHPEVLTRLLQRARELQQDIPMVWSLKYPVRDPAKRDSGVRRE